MNNSSHAISLAACFILAAAGLSGLTGCGETEEASKIEIDLPDKGTLNFESTASSQTINFSTNNKWFVSTDGTDDWVSFSNKSGKSGENSLAVSVSENKSFDERSCEFTIIAGNAKEKIKVVQTEPFMIELSETTLYVGAEASTISLTVKHNIEYEVSFDEGDGWISQVRTKAEAGTDKLEFALTANENESERVGRILITGTNGTKQSVTVTQDGKAGSGWKSKSFAHKSLAMKFTATWCGYCPWMSKSFELAKEKKPDKLELLSLHASSSALSFSGTSSLFKQFKATGYPTGIVDYRRDIDNSSNFDYVASKVISVLEETEMRYPTQTGISYSSSISGNNLSLDLKIYIKKADSYKMTVLLVEDGIVAEQTNGGSNYIHNDIARLSISSISGDSFNISEGFTVYEKIYSAAVPSSLKKDNLRILVIVQRAYGSQQKLRSADYGDYYVDNCASGKAGESLALKTED